MICYVLAMGKQHLGPHVVVGYGIKIFWPGLFITSPDHLGNGAIHSHARSIARVWLKHAHSFDRCGALEYSTSSFPEPSCLLLLKFYTVVLSKPNFDFPSFSSAY